MRSLEMLLINCEVYLELIWIESCVLSSSGTPASFKITDTKLYVPIVILSTKDNVKLGKQLSDGFKRSVYWIEYKTIPTKVINDGTNIYELLIASFQGFRRLPVLTYDVINVDNSAITNNRKYLFPWVDFYGHPIYNLIKQCYEVRIVAIIKGDYYNTGCQLDYTYSKDNDKLITSWFK